MSPEVTSIIVLLVVFVVGTVRSVNLGILGFAAAYAVAQLSLGLTADDVVALFPGDLFLVLVALTLLFGFAQHNGSIEVLVTWIMRACCGRVALAPWVFFLLAAVLIALGALFAVAIVAPLALPFARRYKLDQLMMGMMVVHGALAGAFSPISVYGVTIAGFLGDDVPFEPLTLFLVPLVFDVGVAGVLYAVRGGWRAAGRIDEDADGEGATSARATPYQLVTLGALLVLAVGTTAFGLDITSLALVLATLLALAKPDAAKQALGSVSWSVVVLVTGMVTYIEVLQLAGTVEFVSDGITALGVPLLAALLLYYLAGVTSAMASSVGIISVAIALAVPFLQAGDLDPVLFVVGLAIASTIVDVSPFSTNGALVLANVPEEERDAYYRRLLGYAGIVVAVGPGLAWATVLAPGW
ncbi:SLC13 family permease [uncultured Nocardioides sp.]|uniref:SLC13 family permease n=1 Tax=uncultured Nocardioides sp. TaxID=198441 RepID=UPI00260763C6|nr:SLC13 family permease [uncultured Nocardioides sp.]